MRPGASSTGPRRTSSGVQARAATDATARSESSRWLTKPHVRRFLDAQISDYFSRLEMAGAEALGRVAQDVKADIRELFDEHGRPLPPQLWPGSIANSIEACEVRADGSVRVRLLSKLAGAADHTRGHRHIEGFGQGGRERAGASDPWRPWTAGTEDRRRGVEGHRAAKARREGVAICRSVVTTARQQTNVGICSVVRLLLEPCAWD